MSKLSKIPLAKIGRPRGLKGQVRIDIYNPDSDLFVSGKTFELPVNAAFKKLTIKECDGQWCTFDEIQNVDDARSITGFELSLPREQLPKQKDGTYYHVDLIGCLVLDAGTKEIVGALNDILYTASNDVWVVVNEKEEEILIPILKGVIGKIDLEQNKIFVHVPETI